MLFVLCALAAPEAPPPAAVSGARSLTLVAVGDVLPHRRVKSSAAANGWAAVLGVTDRIQTADLAFANLESPIAPDHHKGIHGEVFNAPASLAIGLGEAGFDVLSMANNHVWDQGVDGMIETRERVMASGMQTVGVGATCAEARAPVVVERKGVKVAFVAWVDLLNSDLRTTEDAPCVFVPGPPCTENCVPDRDALFFRADAEALKKAVGEARELADVVVVSAHWQSEYRTRPLAEYRPLAEVMVAAGADVILGHHPHVLQPVERIEAGGRSGVVAWSLGNFVSDMGKSYDPAVHPVRKGDTRDGGILELELTVTADAVRIEPTFVPTWTANGDTIDVRFQRDLAAPLRAIRSERTRAVVGGFHAEP